MRYHHTLLCVFSSLIIQACGQGLPDSRTTVNNAAPQVENARIEIKSGNEVVIGSELGIVYEYFDSEGDLEGNSRFQWYRDGLAISGANLASYRVIDADAGSELNAEMRPLALSGSLRGELVRVTGVATVNDAPRAESISITGAQNYRAVMGNVLRAEYQYVDAENDSESGSKLQWFRGQRAIVGANTSEYEVKREDIGHILKLAVYPGALTGSSVNIPFYSQAIEVANAAPAVTGVSIRFADQFATIGSRLQLDYEYQDIESDREGNSVIKWYRNGQLIEGASQNTYDVMLADAGKSIRASIQPYAQSGTIQGEPVETVVARYINAPPEMSQLDLRDNAGGQLQAGTQLTASWQYIDNEGDAEGASYILWYRDGQLQSSVKTEDYMLTVDDIGKTIHYELYPLATAGSIYGQSSIHAGVYVNTPPSVTQLRMLDNRAGQILFGTELSIQYQYQDVEQDAEGESRYKWYRNDNAIIGATSASYVLTLDDVGQKIGYSVQPVAVSGYIIGEVQHFSTTVLVDNLAPVAVNAHMQNMQGEILTAANVGATMFARFQYSDHESDAQGTHLYQWYLNDIALDGQFKESYTPIPTDSGQRIKVSITPVDEFGNIGVARLSDNLTVVNAAPFARDVQLIDLNAGELIVGDRLQIVYSYYDPDGDLESTSIIKWYRNGELIAGENADTYTLTFADSGATLFASVEPHAITGVSAGKPVNAIGQNAMLLAPPVLSILPESGKLFFSWNTVPGANAYAFMENADGASGFVDLLDSPDKTLWQIDAPVLSFDWMNAQYYVQACDESACISSVVSGVADKMLEAITHVKSHQPDPGDRFGWQIALSADAKTMAISADQEDGNGQGIQLTNDPMNNSLSNSGAVYIYQWNETDSTWAPEPVYIKASNPGIEDLFGHAIALSGDGNTLAVAAPGEGSDAIGLNGDQLNDRALESGAVYVYHRNIAGQWSTMPVYIKAINTDAYDHFGTSVALSDDGNTLAVGAYGEDSSATGLNGDPSDDSLSAAGAVYVYQRNTAGEWSAAPDYFKSSNSGQNDFFGVSVALSGDGLTLVVGAPQEDGSSTGINGEFNDIELNAGAVYIYRKDVQAGWQGTPVYMKASNTDAKDRFGLNLAINQAGTRLLVGAPGEDSKASGIGGTQINNLYTDSGAAYLFSMAGNGSWIDEPVYIKPPATSLGDQFGGSEIEISLEYGRALAINSIGDTLIIGAAREDGEYSGVNPDVNTNGLNNSGAFYRYRQQTDGSWLIDYIKSANADVEAYFGWGVAVDSLGERVLASSIYEDSDATGPGNIRPDNNRDNSGSSQSGAAYLY